MVEPEVMNRWVEHEPARPPLFGRYLARVVEENVSDSRVVLFEVRGWCALSRARWWARRRGLGRLQTRVSPYAR